MNLERIEIRENAIEILSQGRMLLNKGYLSNLAHYDLKDINNSPECKINLISDVRIFKIERIVLENKQSMLESIASAYTALGVAGYTVFILLKSDGKETYIYLGTRGEPNRLEGGTAGKLLDETFKGHFSGSLLSPIKGKYVSALIDGIFNENIGSITAVTSVPSLSIDDRNHFIQGLEHFIDASEGRVYQAFILAEPVGSSQLDLIQVGYEGIATQLVPLLKQSITFGENESENIGLSIGENINKSFGTSLSLTETRGESLSKGISTSSSETSPTTTSKTATIGLTALGGAIALATGGVGAIALGMAGGGVLGNAFNKVESTSTGDSTVVGSNYATGVTKNTNMSDSYGINRNQSINRTVGSNRQITLDMVDKSIEQLIKRVDHQLERVEEAKRYGGWNTAAYFIGDSPASSRTLASIFLGLMRGDNSNSENFALTTWERDKSKSILDWLTSLTHPRLIANFSTNLGIEYLTPATLVSGKEMAVQLGLPRRSTSTVSVVEAQTFGRRIQNVNGETEKAEKSC